METYSTLWLPRHSWRRDGDLFLALELLSVRKQDTAEVRLKLEIYVTRVCEEESGYAHPLVIVAIARLAFRSSRAKTSDIQHKLLDIFAKLYPGAATLWLNEDEAQHIQSTASVSTGSGSIISGPASVEDKWSL